MYHMYMTLSTSICNSQHHNIHVKDTLNLCLCVLSCAQDKKESIWFARKFHSNSIDINLCNIVICI